MARGACLALSTYQAREVAPPRPQRSLPHEGKGPPLHGGLLSQGHRLHPWKELGEGKGHKEKPLKAQFTFAVEGTVYLRS